MDLSDDKSTLVQVMAWCHQATSHYLSHCWPRSVLPYGITRSQWVKAIQTYLQYVSSTFTKYFVHTLKCIWKISRPSHAMKLHPPLYEPILTWIFCPTASLLSNKVRNSLTFPNLMGIGKITESWFHAHFTNIFPSLFGLDENFILFSFNHCKIYITWQLCCCGICNLITKNWRMSSQLCPISILLENMLVKWLFVDSLLFWWNEI